MTMAQEDRELIYKMIAESDADKIGGMSLISIFLSEYRARTSDQAEELLSSLGDILESDSGDRLVSCAWLVGALATSDVRSPDVEARLRNRLLSMEATAEHLDESDRVALSVLRDADLALHSASSSADGEWRRYRKRVVR